MLWVVENSKAKGLYIKNKSFEYIVIDYFDEENDSTILINFLSEISEGKDIFINASNIDGIEKAEIIHLDLQPRNIKRYKLQLAKIHQDSLNKCIFKNRVICFDIYIPNSKMQWDNYLELQVINSKNEIKKNNMYASVCITEETRVEITCKKGITSIETMISCLNEIGYKIRKVSGIS